jgi:hypothetical protein
MRKITIKRMLVVVAAITGISMLYISTASATKEPGIEKMEQEEMLDWGNQNDTILRNGNPVAIFEHFEYEVNPNHRKPNMQKELCFIQVDNNPDNTKSLIRYIHTKHPDSKIQVEFEEQYERIDRWKEKMN